MSEKFTWITINNVGNLHLTYRAKVFGGWIILYKETDKIGLVFLPDPNHEWKVE